MLSDYLLDKSKVYLYLNRDSNSPNWIKSTLSEVKVGTGRQIISRIRQFKIFVCREANNPEADTVRAVILNNDMYAWSDEVKAASRKMQSQYKKEHGNTGGVSSKSDKVYNMLIKDGFVVKSKKESPESIAYQLIKNLNEPLRWDSRFGYYARILLHCTQSSFYITGAIEVGEGDNHLSWDTPEQTADSFNTYGSYHNDNINYGRKTKEMLNGLSWQEQDSIINSLQDWATENNYLLNRRLSEIPNSSISRWGNEPCLFDMYARKNRSLFKLYLDPKNIKDIDSIIQEKVNVLKQHENNLEVYKQVYDEVDSAIANKVKDIRHFGSGNSIEFESLNEDIQVHDQLNPDLWDENNELKPDVKDKIREIVEKFIDALKDVNVELKPIDVLILGSSANYNYNDTSDIDVHILADTSIIDCPANLLPVVYDAYKKIFNDKYSISIYGHEVEMYVEDTKTSAHSNGIYSLSKGWIKKPVRQDIPDIDLDKFNDELQKWEVKYQEVLTFAGNDERKLQLIKDFINGLHLLRQQSILECGEFGLGNLIFKEMRSKGYIDTLKDVRDELINKELSLESLTEDFSYKANITSGDFDYH